MQKDSVVATLGRFWHVPRFRCCLTGSLGLRQHRLLSASSNQPHSLPPPLSLVDVARSCYLSSPDHLVPSLLHSQLSSSLFNSPLLIKAHQLTLLHTHISHIPSTCRSSSRPVSSNRPRFTATPRNQLLTQISHRQDHHP